MAVPPNVAPEFWSAVLKKVKIDAYSTKYYEKIGKAYSNDFNTEHTLRHRNPYTLEKLPDGALYVRRPIVMQPALYVGYIGNPVFLRNIVNEYKDIPYTCPLRKALPLVVCRVNFGFTDTNTKVSAVRDAVIKELSDKYINSDPYYRKHFYDITRFAKAFDAVVDKPLEPQLLFRLELVPPERISEEPTNQELVFQNFIQRHADAPEPVDMEIDDDLYLRR